MFKVFRTKSIVLLCPVTTFSLHAPENGTFNLLSVALDQFDLKLEVRVLTEMVVRGT